MFGQDPCVKDFYTYFQQLKTERYSRESTWEEISAYFLGLSKAPSQSGSESYAPFARTLMDSSSVLAAMTLASALLGMVFNPNDRNIELGPVDRSREKDTYITRFNQYLASRVMDFILDPEQGVYVKAHELLTEYVMYGQGTMLCEKIGNRVRFKTIATTSCYVDVDDDDKLVVHIREWQWTVRQLALSYPPEEYAWPDNLKAQLVQDPLHKVSLLHAVFPKEFCRISEMVKVGRGKPFTYVVGLKDTPHIFEVKGATKNPFITARYHKFADEKYARGPGEFALPDVRTYNDMGQLNMSSVAKQVSPPLYGPHRGWLTPIDDSPSAITLYDALEGEIDLKPFGVQGNPMIGLEFVDRHRESMFQLFHVDRLRQMQKRAEVKEMELLGDKEERMRDMAPQLARLEIDFVKRLVDLVLYYKFDDFASDYDGEVPQGYDDTQITIRSPLARAQGMLEVANAKRMLDQFFLPIANIDPAVLEKLSYPRLSAYMFDKLGLPASILTTEEESQAAAEKRESQQNAAMQIEAISKGSEGIKNMAQAQQAAPGMDFSQIFGGLQ